MTHVDIKEAQEKLLKLVEQAVEGEEVVITRDDHPVVKLIAATESSSNGKRQFGSAKGLITIEDDFDDPLEDFSEYS